MQEQTDTRWWRPFAWGVALRRWLEHPGTRREPNPWAVDPGRSRRRVQAVRLPAAPNDVSVGGVVAEEDPCGDLNESHPQSALVIEPTAPTALEEWGEPTMPHPTPIASLRSVHPSGETDPLGWQAAGAVYRRKWQQGRGRTGGDWADAEPGYHYAFERAKDGGLRGRSWKQVEAELAEGFADWSQRHGYEARWITWDSLHAHVRDVWDELAGPLAAARLRAQAS
jgi:hypothetical protein